MSSFLRIAGAAAVVLSLGMFATALPVVNAKVVAVVGVGFNYNSCANFEQLIGAQLENCDKCLDSNLKLCNCSASDCV